VRTSSRGLFWLEPLLEVDTPQGRAGYREVSPDQVASLLDVDLAANGDHLLSVGLVEQLPYLKTQQRLLFARAGITSPLSLEHYLAHGGYQGWSTRRG
jgi:formate dehydrogenase iron-sulfur subunit